MDDPRPPSQPRALEPTAERAVGRRFGDDEIERILKKAAELQEYGGGGAAGPASGLSIEELRQVAAEAGIDPRYVDLAAADLNSPENRQESKLAGGPISWHYHTTIDGEIRDSDKDRLLQAIRSVMGQRGEIVEVFGRMEWTHDDGVGPVLIGITNRDGKTEIDVTVNRSQEAGLYHGLGIPFGGVFGGASIAGLLGLSGGFALPLVAACGGLAYGAARVVWKHRARWWEERMERVIERIASVAQDMAVRPALPESTEE